MKVRASLWARVRVLGSKLGLGLGLGFGFGFGFGLGLGVYRVKWRGPRGSSPPVRGLELGIGFNSSAALLSSFFHGANLFSSDTPAAKVAADLRGVRLPSCVGWLGSVV